MTDRATPGARARYRHPDRAAIMADVRASIARISRAAAEPGVFVLPVIKDASAHLAQLNAIAAEAREADAREGVHV